MSEESSNLQMQNEYQVYISGPYEKLFYRKDRHCHFLNWLVVTDIKGYIVYSRPGFMGHLNDSTCLS